MKNITCWIFSIILWGCTGLGQQGAGQNRTEFDEFEQYLTDHGIRSESDSVFYVMIVPSTCLNCIHWIHNKSFKSVNNLILITSNPLEYFDNFSNVFEDEESDFIKLSFFHYNPMLITVEVSNQTITAELIDRNVFLKLMKLAGENEY
ncbi:MAG: hypothetical protein GC181_12340 [Bacteroidetes bacterium]|nr:hypothetical protein [Bacteroidota bacterium]